MTVTQTTKPIMKRKGLLAGVLIAVALVAALLLYFAYQPQGAFAPAVTHTTPVYAATGAPLNTKLLVRSAG